MPDTMKPDAASDAALALWRAIPHHGLPDTLGMEILELGPERVVATMPVDRRTHQPFGILHGGASVALAESVASLGAWMNCDRERQSAVGIEINANHLRSKTEGIVRAVGVPVHRGTTTHVWSIEIRDEQERLVCVSRCTLAIVEKRKDDRS